MTKLPEMSSSLETESLKDWPRSREMVLPLALREIVAVELGVADQRPLDHAVDGVGVGVDEDAHGGHPGRQDIDDRPRLLGGDPSRGIGEDQPDRVGAHLGDLHRLPRVAEAFDLYSHSLEH